MGVTGTATGTQEKRAESAPSSGPRACQRLTHPPMPILWSKLTRWELRPWAGSKKVGWVRSSSAALLSDAAGKSLKPSSRRSLRHRLCYWGVSPPSLAARTLRARDRKCQGGPAGHVTPEHGRHDTFRWFPPSPAGTRLVSFSLAGFQRGRVPGSWLPHPFGLEFLRSRSALPLRPAAAH